MKFYLGRITILVVSLMFSFLMAEANQDLSPIQKKLLHLVRKGKEKEAVSFLKEHLKKEPFLVNLKTKQGDSILIYAIKYKKNYLAERLIQLGANLNSQNAFGETALILSIKNKDKFITKLLLSMGCDPTIQDNQKQDASFYAKSYKNREVYQLIQTYKARLPQ